MAVTRETLRLLRQASTAVGAETDQTVRDLTEAWAKAWTRLAPYWAGGAADLAAAGPAGRLPPWQIARIASVAAALDATRAELDDLAELAGTRISDGAARVAALTTAAGTLLIVSQLPAGFPTPNLMVDLHAGVLGGLTARAQRRVVDLTAPIPAAVSETISRIATRPAPAATTARTASQLTARVEAGFHSGLTRALTVARTETLDIHRAVAATHQQANARTVGAWQWISSADRRTCIACWVMHGTTHPPTVPGPLGHPNCRCTRLPVVRAWRNLGIAGTEPVPAMVDGQAMFRALPRPVQRRILGPTRLDLLDSSAIRWTDLAVLRDNPGWRPAYTPRPVADLLRTAARSQRTA